MDLARQPGATDAVPAGSRRKLYCVSYTPFRGTQTPLDPSTMIPAAQIEDDLTRLSTVTDCVKNLLGGFRPRPDSGASPAKHGLKVMQGLWLSSSLEKSRYQIETSGRARQQIPGHHPVGCGW